MAKVSKEIKEKSVKSKNNQKKKYASYKVQFNPGTIEFTNLEGLAFNRFIGNRLFICRK